MKRQSIFAMMAMIVVVGGCTTGQTTDVNAFAQLDPYQRTIAVSAPAGDLTLWVENVLKKNDFQIGDSQQAIRNPRYSMQLSYNSKSSVDVCFPNLDPKFDYDLTINDLRMGGRVFGMHGTDCRHTILERLDAYIKNKPM